MDWLNLFYIIVGLVTIAGFVYAIDYNRRNSRRKLLTHDITSPLSLISVLSEGTEDRLSITYEREGSEPVKIENAYLYYVRVANLGEEPIRREDLATSDPLRLDILNGTVLNLASVSVTRDVLNFDLSPLAQTGEGVSSSQLSFDFLDYRDGALIKVLTDSSSSQVMLKGTIIGMPQGIARTSELDPNISKAKLFTGLFVLLVTVILGSTLTVFIRQTKGALMATLCLIATIVFSVSVCLWMLPIQKEDKRWPDSLKFPTWFKSRYQLDKMGFK
jgi:hypothetical protein